MHSSIKSIGRKQTQTPEESGKSRSPVKGATTSEPALQEAGNQAVQALFQAGLIQPKLAVGAPDNPEERQADLFADRVIRRLPVGECDGISCPKRPAEQALDLQRSKFYSSISQLHIQRQARNKNKSSALSALESPIQAKLTVGAPNDEYEREADQVAETVMRLPDTNVAKPFEVEQEELSGESQIVQTKSIAPLYVQNVCTECEEELQQDNSSSVSPPPIQPKSNGEFSLPTTHRVANTIQSPSGGSPLPQHIQSRVSGFLGNDLSHVKVHNDSKANEAAQSINAKAFTHQNHIYLGKGQSTSDIQLMVHEATHVVQQSRATPQPTGQDGLCRQAFGRVQEPVIQRQVAEVDETGSANGSESRLADIVTELLTTGELDDSKADAIGRVALRTLGYEGLLTLARRAGMVRSGRPRPSGQNTASGPNVIRRQAVAAFGEVLTKYAVAAGVASQADPVVPGPGDIVALGILAVGLVAATMAARETTRTAPRLAAGLVAATIEAVSETTRTAPRTRTRRRRRGRWSCDAKCNVQQIKSDAVCPDHVYGTARGPSQEEACREARRVATQSTPLGCYPRHCDCKCVKT